MCIIAVISNKQQLLSEKMIRKCWDSNPDGAGFMYTDQEEPWKIVVRKGFMNLQDLLDAWKEYKLKPRTVGYTVIHFRIGTSGGKTASMTHPFITYNDDVDTTQAIAHNGIIDIPHDRAVRSDTAQFAEMIREMTRSVDWVQCDFTRRMVELFVGEWNKIVVLTGDRVDIMNEESGELDNMGRWWSNGGWRARKSRLKNVCDPRLWGKDDHVTDDVEDEDDDPRVIKPPAYAGDPPVHDKGEKWEWDSVWDCWVCTQGKREGAIAMPSGKYFGK